MITAKIDVTKIQKERLYKGSKGTYLDIALIPTPNSEYGDFMIVQSVSKEERDKGVRGPILGNAKNMQSRKESSGASQPTSDASVPEGQVPF